MAFLRQHHPFSELSDEQLAQVGSGLQIVHLGPGEVFLREDGSPAESLGMIRKGEIELVAGDVVVDLLEPGDVFGVTSVMTDRPPTMTVRAIDDTLCYLVPAAVARTVLSSPEAAASVWSIARQRVRAADAAARALHGADPRFARIGTLLRRAPVTIEPGATVAEAAARMRDERVSSLLIHGPEGWAILTDRDLRSRVVAERGSFDRPVIELATQPVQLARPDLLAGEAILRMLEFDIHHLPVADGDRLLGVITDTDLMDLDRTSPFAIRSAIRRAGTRTEVVFAARGYPAVVTGLVDAGADPLDAARVISLIADAATARLLALAQEEIGEPPCAFSWLALGSAARHERSLHSDQDHALVLAETDETTDAYFADLAERVTGGLEEIGFPRCTGDAMAVHPAMRASLATWVERFRTWIHQADVDSIILSSIGFDYRSVAGTLEVEAALDAAVAEARRERRFLKLLARVALREEPPTGFVRGLVVESKGTHAGTLDVKHGGVTIVTSIARARGIAAGTPAKDTLSRLRASTEAGTLGAEEGAGLAEAFRFLTDVRLRHQVAQVRAGVAPDDFLDPATLGTIERAGLREAFRFIRAEQSALALDLGLR